LCGHFGDADVADVAKLADQAGSKGRKVAQPLALAATTYVDQADQEAAPLIDPVT
jgi:hypothetical protein